MSENAIKEMFDKAQNYDNLMISTRGYAYDSLIFRFKDYQSRAFQSEVTDYKYRKNVSELEARYRVKDKHDRDLMRFIQILDSVIGEHD
jgi:hypothetical protein